MSLLRKAQEKWRHGLVLQWLSDQLTNIGMEITPFYWVKEHYCETLPEGLTEEDFKDFSFEELGPDDMPQVAKLSGGWFVAEEIQSEVVTPDIKCFALKKDGEIACFTWFNLRQCSSYLRPVELKDDEAYLYAMYTDKPYRGRSLAPYLRLKAMEVLKSRGKNTFYSISVYFNRSSISFKKRLNAEFLELHLRIMLFKRFGFCRRLPMLRQV